MLNNLISNSPETVNPTTEHARTVATQCLSSIAPILKASGDPLRLEILRVLQRDTFGVMELCNIFDSRQSGMSHHLKVLHKAGLVETQREGNSIFYRRPIKQDDEINDELIHSLFGIIDQTDISVATAERINLIKEQRAEQSQAFFSRYADKFKEQQELIALFEQYAVPVVDLINAHDFDDNATAMEIGPGEGAFLNELSTRFNKVYALDNSAGMLNKAKTHADENKLTNIEFVLGESSKAVQENMSVDAIVLNMVLHHIPSPADIFTDCAQLLNDDGIMLISDLSHHDQNWVKENCGDLWLGFESEELSLWAKNAGLDEGESLYIGLRNGFQIQVREFIKR
ncbi:ArsR/SmtB family transcription factor [Alkalimarinus sediminis]|uniref:Metalloregulator ArsR/SmtB family transcription factor n=1 Tax=Alkalimarinus sediminis TaxID=1632866 RepID=A0A9E8HFJ3_9ALTE|nr:metalloregulator ArsR/SmtB family transcription factor [Alkalimarinus sediminis]UZW73710.1 metalloregulator ArsR/SmtB family transcription factor [Alkalimarinus sediminis]